VKPFPRRFLHGELSIRDAKASGDSRIGKLNDIMPHSILLIISRTRRAVEFTNFGFAFPPTPVTFDSFLLQVQLLEVMT
jgi:hypothetical protein